MIDLVITIAGCSVLVLGGLAVIGYCGMYVINRVGSVLIYAWEWLTLPGRNMIGVCELVDALAGELERQGSTYLEVNTQMARRVAAARYRLKLHRKTKPAKDKQK